MAGCATAPVVETPPPETIPPAPATTVPPPTTEPAPELVVEPLAGFEARSVVFGNVEYRVTDVKVSNQTLRSYASGADPEIGDEFFAFLDITAVNQMSGTMSGRLDASIYRLELADAEVGAADQMGFLSDLTGFIRANTGVDSFLAFPVAEGTDLSSAVLVIGASPDRRARLPLTGPVPEHPYPLEVELGVSAEGDSPTNPGGRIVFTVLGARLTEDSPHENATSPTGLRANEDELFLVFHVQAEKIAGGGPDAINTSAFRLIVDGVPRSPWDAASHPQGSQGSPRLDPGSAVDVWVAFMLPVDAVDLVLQAGLVSGDPALIPIELPPLP